MSLSRLSGSASRLLSDLRFGRRYQGLRFARRYDRGKGFEDHEANLIRLLEGRFALDGAIVVDIGTGTGQMAKRVGSRVGHFYGFDVSSSMISVAMAWRRSHALGSAITFGVAAATEIPLPDQTADIVIYPWSMNSIIAPHWEGDWQGALGQVLGEATRLCREGGSIVVVETASLMGELPWGEIWHPIRRGFLAALEQRHGFRSTLFANDWNFRTARNARRYAELWFTPETVRQVLRSGTTVLHECAGIWYTKVSSPAPCEEAPVLGST